MTKETLFPIREGKSQEHMSQRRQLGCADCHDRRTGWFCSLDNPVLAELELASSADIFPTHCDLFLQGEDAIALYLVCGGYLKLTAGRTNERQMVIRIAGPGSILGLYAVLSHGEYEVSAKALTPVQIRSFKRGKFLDFLSSHKEVQRQAMQNMCQEYRFALEGACRVGLSTVSGRIGHLLLDLARQIGGSHLGPKFGFPLLLTHEEIASMVCSTRETVTRTLSQFRKDGWISVEGSEVAIHQPELLRASV